MDEEVDKDKNDEIENKDTDLKIGKKWKGDLMKSDRWPGDKDDEEGE